MSVCLSVCLALTADSCTVHSTYYGVMPGFSTMYLYLYCGVSHAKVTPSLGEVEVGCSGADQLEHWICGEKVVRIMHGG